LPSPLSVHSATSGATRLRGPGLRDLDFSLFKNHQLSRRNLKIQFRAEVFNLLNRANLQAQLVTLLKAGLDRRQLQPPTVTSSRQIHLGTKLNW